MTNNISSSTSPSNNNDPSISPRGRRRRSSGRHQKTTLEPTTSTTTISTTTTTTMPSSTPPPRSSSSNRRDSSPFEWKLRRSTTTITVGGTTTKTPTGKERTKSPSSSSPVLSHNMVDKENNNNDDDYHDVYNSPSLAWSASREGQKKHGGSTTRKKERSHGIDPSQFHRKMADTTIQAGGAGKNGLDNSDSRDVTTTIHNSPSKNNGAIPSWKVRTEHNLLIQEHEQHTKQLETQRKEFRQVTQLKTWPLQEMAIEHLDYLLHLSDRNNNNKTTTTTTNPATVSQFHGGDYLSSESSSSVSSVETSRRPRLDEALLDTIVRGDDWTHNNNKNQHQTTRTTTHNRDIDSESATLHRSREQDCSLSGSVLWSLEPRIFAIEKAQGKRKYLVGHFGRIADWYWRKATPPRHLYEVIRAETPCRLYFDLEYNKQHNPELVSPASLIHELQLELATDLRAFYGLTLVSTQIINLDSSTEDKFSRHWIVRLTQKTETEKDDDTPSNDNSTTDKNQCNENQHQLGQDGREVLFRDAPTVGRFVKRLVGRLADEIAVSGGDFATKRPALTKYLFVNTKDVNKKTCFIDLGVYTRNRLFRCLGSSKYGKTSSLEVMQNEEVYDESENNNINIHYYPLEFPQQQQKNELFAHHFNESTSSLTPLLSLEDFVVANDWEPYAKALADTLVVPLHDNNVSSPEATSCAESTTTILDVPLEGPYAGMTSANCSSTASSKLTNFSSGGGGAIIPNQQSRNRVVPVCIPISRAGSPIPSLDMFVSEFLANRGGIQGSIRAWSIEYGPRDAPVSITYQMQRNRFCELVGRAHKSNNIFWTIDFGSWTCMQGCHDPDCHGRGCPVPISNQKMTGRNDERSFLERIKEEFDAWQETEFEKALMALDLDDVVAKGFVRQNADCDLTPVISTDNKVIKDDKQRAKEEEDEISDELLSDDVLLKAMMENPDLFP